MHHLLEPTTDSLSPWLAERGYPAYRAGQVRSWVFARRAGSFDDMTDLPRQVRGELAAEFSIFATRIARHSRADDGTQKLLLELADGGRIECVLLVDGPRRTICISSQVGCAMGCVFCASGLDGVERNLTAGEIVEQMLRLQQLLPPDERLSHIVVMGMGEPLANLDAVRAALAVARGDDGLGIGARRITISTVGLPAAIRKLAQVGTPYNLAVSLHAPGDELRNELVPVNKNTGLAAILDAADDFFQANGRRLTFEYVLLGDVNDSPRHAQQLVRLLRGRMALVNVIPYNPVAGLSYRTPSKLAVHAFRNVLVDGGLHVKFRQRKGSEIDAACGQLRRLPIVAPSPLAPG